MYLRFKFNMLVFRILTWIMVVLVPFSVTFLSVRSVIHLRSLHRFVERKVDVGPGCPRLSGGLEVM